LYHNIWKEDQQGRYFYLKTGFSLEKIAFFAKINNDLFYFAKLMGLLLITIEKKFLCLQSYCYVK